MKTLSPDRSPDTALLLPLTVTLSHVRAQAGVCRWISEPDLLSAVAAADPQWLAFMSHRARRLRLIHLIRQRAQELDLERFGRCWMDQPIPGQRSLCLIWVL